MEIDGENARQGQITILTMFTADTSFNMFAAEVVAHAEAVESFWADISSGYYNSALRADMTISGTYDFWRVFLFENQYYNESGSKITEQRQYHGMW